MASPAAAVDVAARAGAGASAVGPRREVEVARTGDGHLRAAFMALGGPCELLLDADDTPAAQAALAALAALAAAEAWRIEDKFSRYRPCGVVHQIHHAAGAAVTLDEESAALIAYADTCHHLSGGAFDITSGVLRRVWRFEGGRTLPAARDVQALLPQVGWHRVEWRPPVLRLPAGMEIDLGGIGKEYAVDRVAQALARAGFTSALVNFGGDLRALGPRRNGSPWHIGVDDPRRTGEHCVAHQALHCGALATSGDARRFIEVGGRRYGHILDPRTGWPVRRAPRSVTVQAPTCLEAGMLATFAVLQGQRAEAFLQSQGAVHLVVW